MHRTHQRARTRARTHTPSGQPPGCFRKTSEQLTRLGSQHEVFQAVRHHSPAPLFPILPHFSSHCASVRGEPPVVLPPLRPAMDGEKAMTMVRHPLFRILLSARTCARPRCSPEHDEVLNRFASLSHGPNSRVRRSKSSATHGTARSMSLLTLKAGTGACKRVLVSPRQRLR